MLEALIVVLFPLAAAAAATSDLVTMTIPNRISLILIAAFFPVAWAVGMTPSSMGGHLGVAAILFAVGYTCYMFGWIGGGDVKFATVAVLWLGPSLTTEFIGLFGVLGGLLSLGLLMFRGSQMPPQLLGVDFIARLHEPKAGVPYGIAIGAAALMLYPETEFMRYAVAHLAV